MCLREWRVAVGGLRVGGGGVRGEGAGAAHSALYLVRRRERRVSTHTEPLEREERTGHLRKMFIR